MVVAAVVIVVSSRTVSRKLLLEFALGLILVDGERHGAVIVVLVTFQPTSTSSRTGIMY